MNSSSCRSGAEFTVPPIARGPQGSPGRHTRRHHATTNRSPSRVMSKRHKIYGVPAYGLWSSLVRPEVCTYLYFNDLVEDDCGEIRT